MPAPPDRPTPGVERSSDLMTRDIANLDLGQLAENIQQAHLRCRAALHQGLQHALEAGKLLIQAKERVPHGKWLPWLEEHCDLSERLAQKYMQVARELPKLGGSNPPRVADLSFRQALELIADNAAEAARVPELDRPEALDRAAEEVLRRRRPSLREMEQAREEERRRRRDAARKRGIDRWHQRQREEDRRRAGMANAIDGDGYDGYLE